MNSLYGTEDSSSGSSAVTLEQHFWPRRIKERTATLIVSGFSPQVRSARKNVVGVRRRSFLQRSTWSGLIREQSRSGTFWFFLVTKRTEKK